MLSLEISYDLNVALSDAFFFRLSTLLPCFWCVPMAHFWPYNSYFMTQLFMTFGCIMREMMMQIMISRLCLAPEVTVYHFVDQEQAEHFRRDQTLF